MEIEINEVWAQGSVILPQAIEGKLRDHEIGAVCDDILIVATQSCDLIHRSLDDEPYVEFLIGHHIDAPDGNYTFGKNPRCFDFSLDDGPRYYRCLIKTKVQLPRNMLVGKEPVAKLDDETMRLLARWIGRRYTRRALPDSFNRRIGPVVPRLRNALKTDGGDLTSLYLSFDREEELAEEVAYRVVLIATVLPEVRDDEERFQRATQVTASIHAALNACGGVEVVDSVIKGEDEITLHDLRNLAKLEYEYISAHYGGEVIAEP